ncbi:MAG: metal ABC transporter substrate-binding protein [Anaerovoracaceae bacterium]
MNKDTGRKKRHVLLTAFLPALLAFLTLSGCRAGDMPSGVSGSCTGKPSIVCTAFPQYDWTLQILGGRADQFSITLLNHQGADMHSFQPTAANMVSMANCDLFIHMGGYSESWVPAALESAENPDAAVLTLLDHVEKLEEEFTPGMAHDAHHDHDHEHAQEDGHEAEHETEEVEYDEHLWLSLRCAQDACRSIADAVCRLDPAYAEEYESNLQRYCSRLQALDREYEMVVRNAECPILLFADRFPFRYLAHDYDIECFAAFPGCSAETEASFETIIALSEELSAHQLQSVILLEGSKSDFAQTVIRNSAMKEARILTLNSMQAAGQREADAGITYLSIMEDNLQVLKTALQAQ